MQPILKNTRYRAEIDGLRAIAVLAVVLFHAELGVPGGFVGVDIFFVISGFLITSLILKDLAFGTFSLAGFWERRIRRILPALVIVSLATLMAGWIVLLPDDYAELGRSVFFQALFVANIYFWLNTGYFDGASEEMPLLHTWSLAVEEQFYLVFPLMVVGLFAITKLERRGPMLTIFTLCILLSLGASIWGLNHYPAGTFYLLPTRIWELLLGASVAILPPPTFSQGNRSICRPRIISGLRELISIAALVAILLPCWLYTHATPFPGLAAIPPCLGAGIFIWITGYKHPEERVTLVARTLSARPLVFIGLISYSLYLWHWPLFAFSNYLSIDPLPGRYRFCLVVLGVFLAVLSWRFIETPFRTGRYCDSRKAVFGTGAMATALVLVCGLAIQYNFAIPQRFTDEALAYAKRQVDMAFIHELEVQDIVEGRLTPIGATRQDSRIDWLVWGDSHAMAVTPAFHQYLEARGLAGQAATHSWTAPLIGYFKGTQFGMGLDSLDFNQAVFEHIKVNAIPNVVLVGAWSGYQYEPSDHPSSGAFQTSLIATVHAIHEAGAQPWVMLQIPSQGFDVPKVLAQYAMANQPIEPLCAKPNPEEYAIANVPGLLEQLQTAGAVLLDPRPYCLSEDGTHYRVVQDGKPLYRDSGHLSIDGAIVIVLPLLEDSIHDKP